MIKTLTLDGLTSVTIKQSAHDMDRFCRIDNYSESPIFASCTDPNCTEKADGVAKVPANGWKIIDTESFKTLYLSGSGEAELTTSAYCEALSSFNHAAKGGVTDTVFSTEEQAAGTWIDGRTIYKKTVVFNVTKQSTTSMTKTNYGHGIENVGLIWFSGDSFWEYGGTVKPLAFQTGIGDSLETVNTVAFNCGVNTSEINIMTGTAYDSVTVYATLMYVKNEEG